MSVYMLRGNFFSRRDRNVAALERKVVRRLRRPEEA
jgi:hypothetical protein